MKIPQRSISRGFTLVELLVVISIIAILAGFSLTVFSSIKKNAAKMQQVRNFEQIHKAIGVYKAQNQGYFPGSSEDGGGLAAFQSPSRQTATNLAFYLADVLQVDREEEEFRQEVPEMVPKILLPTIEAAGDEGWNRPIFYLFHVRADVQPEEEITMGSLTKTGSFWGRPASVIEFKQPQAPMFSDIYMTKDWDDYKKGRSQITFWGNVFNVLYVDGHVESYKEPNFEWRSVVKGS